MLPQRPYRVVPLSSNNHKNNIEPRSAEKLRSILETQPFSVSFSYTSIWLLVCVIFIMFSDMWIVEFLNQHQQCKKRWFNISEHGRICLVSSFTVMKEQPFMRSGNISLFYLSSTLLALQFEHSILNFKLEKL